MLAAMHLTQIAAIAVLSVIVVALPFWAGFVAGRAWERGRDE